MTLTLLGCLQTRMPVATCVPGTVWVLWICGLCPSATAHWQRLLWWPPLCRRLTRGFQLLPPRPPLCLSWPAITAHLLQQQATVRLSSIVKTCSTRKAATESWWLYRALSITVETALSVFETHVKAHSLKDLIFLHIYMRRGVCMCNVMRHMQEENTFLNKITTEALNVAVNLYDITLIPFLSA